MGIVLEQPLKPPTTIFLLCVLLLVCSTLVMAIYIQHSHFVPNPEASKNWDNLLHGLENLELCARATNDIPSTPELMNEFNELLAPPKVVTSHPSHISLTVLANVKLIRELARLPSGPIAITGKAFLEDSRRLCNVTNTQVESAVNISFMIPAELTQSEPKEVCVILSGSTEILPLSRPASVCIPQIFDVNQTRLGVLTGRLNKTLPESLSKNKDGCENGSILQINYKSGTETIIYLSPMERERITWNLQVLSGSLLLFCVSFVAFRLILTRRYILVENDTYSAPTLT